jgi:hypothetical protein
VFSHPAPTSYFSEFPTPGFLDADPVFSPGIAEIAKIDVGPANLPATARPESGISPAERGI